jgi:hypothetical protein
MREATIEPCEHELPSERAIREARHAAWLVYSDLAKVDGRGESEARAIGDAWDSGWATCEVYVRAELGRHLCALQRRLILSDADAEWREQMAAALTRVEALVAAAGGSDPER